MDLREVIKKLNYFTDMLHSLNSELLIKYGMFLFMKMMKGRGLFIYFVCQANYYKITNSK